MSKKPTFMKTLAALLVTAAMLCSGEARGDDSREATHFPAIVKIASEDALKELEEIGAQILRRRDDLLLCFIPLVNGEVPPIAIPNAGSPRRGIRGENDSPVLKVERRGKAIPLLDKARGFFGADRIHTGEGLPRPYTGKGVVAGICDIGFDPSHIAFRNPDGSSRVARVVVYEEDRAGRRILENESQYAEWRTDTDDEYHATHVIGIMAGSYDGNGYQGMATGADIVVTLSQLSDVGLLCGAEDILDYARERSMPAVINMSMGNYTGPRDGTSLFSQYLDKIGREAIVVLSSGNDGKSTNSLRFDFTEAAGDIRVRLHNTRWTQFDMYGVTDAWSADATPLKARFLVYDGESQQVVWASDYMDFKDKSRYMFSSEGPDADPEFARYYTGYFTLTGGIDPDNGRFNICAEYDAHTIATEPQGRWALYNLMLEYSAEPGAHVDINSDSSYTRLAAVPGYPSPGSTLSFSDLSSGENLISVGMYNSRDTYPLLSGETGETGLTAGTVSPYSSYGTLIDGRVMPLTVGPGSTVISACSRPFIDAKPERRDEASAVTSFEGEDFYWISCTGTSMSSPFVAGSIATWLEAAPSLGIDDVKRIIEATNRQDHPDPEDPHHGRGWFDPWAGLKEALAVSAVKDLDESSEPHLSLSLSGRILLVTNPHPEPALLTLYSVDGQRIMTCTSDACGSLDLSPLPSGIYIADAKAGARASTFLKFRL